MQGLSMGPTKVLVYDPCAFGLPEILTVAHVCTARGSKRLEILVGGPRIYADLPSSIPVRLHS